MRDFSERSEEPTLRPRLADIARAAGLSKATVSYALSGGGGIAPDTRERVLEVAAQLGYRPRNRGHEAGRRGTLGAILSPTRHEGETPNYYVAELMQGAAAEARRAGFELQVAMWDGSLPEMVRARHIQGLLFLGGLFSPEVLRTLDKPMVLVGTFFPQLACDAVMADSHSAAYLATLHLLDAGRGRVGLVNGPPHTTTSDGKWLGYRDALGEAGVDLDPALIAVADFLPAEGYEAGRRLLAAAEPPDALFVADDAIALGVLQAAADLGLRVPDDLAVVGYGDSPMATMLRPELSSIRVFQRRMAQTATQRLLTRLRGGADSHVRMLLEPELIVRGSSDPAQAPTAATAEG